MQMSLESPPKPLVEQQTISQGIAFVLFAPSSPSDISVDILLIQNMFYKLCHKATEFEHMIFILYHSAIIIRFYSSIILINIWLTGLL